MNNNKNIFIRIFLVLQIMILGVCLLSAQQVPIINHTINANGQAELKIVSSTDNYYILRVRPDINSPFDITTSMTLGEFGTTTITEPLGNYPLDHYQVTAYPIASPADIDGDGIDDMTEYQNRPLQSPTNAAPSMNIIRGLVCIDSFTTFKKVSVRKETVQWSPFLDGKEFVKYLIEDFDSPNPKIYFINSNTHNLHADFAAVAGIDYLGDHVKKGQVIYYPTSISNNGTLGTYAFNYSNGISEDFDVVQRTHELLAANMPFLKNNLSYFITENNEISYQQDLNLYQNSRVPVLFEADVYGDVDYWGLNLAEGFGFFREIALGETPGAKDIVLYESLPNSLPRVGGIMTSVIQTPLSHVNLRAIQNKVPNAFIRDPLDIDSIANLLDHYIYFKVEQDRYFIREATVEEVNDWFEDIRPTEEQNPPLNLEYTSILPLDEITFGMFDGFGAKCANVATMRTFGFPDGTIPDGFGIPFYFYQAFMTHNNLFEEIETIINDPDFQSDRNIREEILKEFRKKIKRADMPAWMTAELTAMQESFPVGTSIRCRSSTNNEDLPGFNGAGLYDSKTQHPDEGHISKSVKQVYASLWNLRAFEERDFYRISHFITSMGILCHPNFTNEKTNGVGVSIDPIYNTSNTFYLNSQIGEELITNPGENSIPEEILLDRGTVNSVNYTIIQRSNLISSDSLVMEEYYLGQMRDYLSVIHDKFAILYDAVGNLNFAMDIEYKVTSDNQLIIKQARPWVSYILEEEFEKEIGDDIDWAVFPNPANEYVTVQCNDCYLTEISILNMMGQRIKTERFDNTNASNPNISINDLPSGIYIIYIFVNDTNRFYSKKIIKK